MEIKLGDLSDPRVQELVQTHLARARAETAEGCAHALDTCGLQSSEVTFWTLWEQDELLGMGALQELTSEHGEVKSMYISDRARRRGVGSQMLSHIIAAARERGIKRLSLETGSWDYFTAARAFYQRHGFIECPPFSDYVLDPNSVFMTREL